VSEVLEERIEVLKEALDQHQGDHRLYFNIKDHEEKISIDMSARLQKVNVSGELLALLDEHEITYGVG
jgi:DNA polymerase-3 subunit alpha